jgi:hypothetical protein
MRGHVAGDTLSFYLSRLEQLQTSTPLAGRAGIRVPHRLPWRQGNSRVQAATPPRQRLHRRFGVCADSGPGHLASGSNAARLGAQGMPAIWLRNRPDATR